MTWDYTLPPPPTLAKVKAIFFRFLTFLARDLRGLENIKVCFSFVNVSNTLGSSVFIYISSYESGEDDNCFKKNYIAHKGSGNGPLRYFDFAVGDLTE